MKDLNRIVEECITQHEGGERFFDALDERIRENINLLHSMVAMISFSNFDRIIVSGKFGNVFKEFIESNYPLLKVTSVNGSLRGKDSKVEFEPDKSLEKQIVIFVDDSFYSGTTRNKIKDYIEKSGGFFTDTYVFYDGSKNKDKTVHSFFRYYK